MAHLTCWQVPRHDAAQKYTFLTVVLHVLLPTVWVCFCRAAPASLFRETGTDVRGKPLQRCINDLKHAAWQSHLVHRVLLFVSNTA